MYLEHNEPKFANDSKKNAAFLEKEHGISGLNF